MMRLNIVTLTTDLLAPTLAHVLRMPAGPVDVTDPEALARSARVGVEMANVMLEYDGAAIAAQQVGSLSQIIVVEQDSSSKIPFRVMLNPEVTEASDEQEELEEGCLSIPGRGGVVRRPTSITFKYCDLAGRPHEEHAKGYLARIIQHEVDHLHGRLYPDLMQAGAVLQATETTRLQRARALVESQLQRDSMHK